MVFKSDTQAAPDTREYPLETVRAIAVFLLVSYHVIGSSPHGGLELSYPHPLRIYADYLIDVRMPFFAFIAGYVYGLRPVKPDRYRSFVTGKFHRLYVPGAIAAILFAVTATVLGKTGFARNWGDAWQVLFFPYAHYWFLQAILLIFVFFGAFDAWAGGRFTLPVFGAAMALYLADPFIPGNLMSVNQAIYLLPFFLLGLVFIRHTPWIRANTPLLVILGGSIAIAGSIWNLNLLHETGRLSMDRQDLHSLLMGLAICSVAVLTLPRVPWLELLAPFAFTIYLYHVFATAGVRSFLHAIGIAATLPNFVLEITAGLAAPVILHLLANRAPLARRYMLGKRR